MFHVKHFFAPVAVALVLTLAIVSAFAAPTANPVASPIGGALSAADTYRLARAVTAQWAFIDSSSISPQVLSPLFITAEDPVGDEMYTYRVYIAQNSVKVEAIPEDWGVQGAEFALSATYVYVCEYAFGNSGGMGQRIYKYLGGEPLTLAAREQIVYLYRGTGVGTNELFNYGYFSVIPAVDNWLNAMQAYEGNLTPEQVTEAEEYGYTTGYNEGYTQGQADGYLDSDNYWASRVDEIRNGAYAEGYAEGYDRAVANAGEGDSYTLDIPAIFSAIPSSAKAIINNAFGFELFGINVAGLLSVLLIVSIVAFIVGKLIK